MSIAIGRKIIKRHDRPLITFAYTGDGSTYNKPANWYFMKIEKDKCMYLGCLYADGEILVGNVTDVANDYNIFTISRVKTHNSNGNGNWIDTVNVPIKISTLYEDVKRSV